MSESEKEIKSLLIKVKDSEKTGLKLNSQKMKIMASSSITTQQIDGEAMETVKDQTLFSWVPKSLQMMTAAMKLEKTLAPQKKSYDQPRQHIKKQRHYFADKDLSS